MLYRVIWTDAKGKTHRSIRFGKIFALEQAAQMRGEGINAHVEDENGNTITE